VLGGSGATRTVTITPQANVLGTTTISLTVTDTDGGSTTRNFAVLVTQPVTLPFADNFNRTDNFFLGAGWVQTLGNLQNISNAAQSVTPLAIATLNGVSVGDVSVQTDVTLGAVGNQFAGLVARYSGTGDQNMYWGALIGLNGNFEADIFKNVNGVWTQLASTPLVTGTGTLRFDVVGSSLKLYINDVLKANANDASITTPGDVGLRVSSVATEDNFSAAAISLTNQTLPFSDTFTQANGTRLSSSWLARLGDFHVQSNALVSNVIDPASTDPLRNLALATVNGINASNVSVQADVTVGTSGTQFGGPIARYSGPGDQNMYWGTLTFTNNAYEADILRNLNGTWTILASTPITGTIPTTNTMRLDVAGPSLKLFMNGNLVTFASDTALTTGTVGVRESNAITTDNFNASAITLNNVTLPFTDDFNRADGQLGPNWIDQLGNTTVQGNAALTHVIDPSSGDPNKFEALSTLSGVSSANVSIQADVTVPNTGGTQYSGLVARYAGPGEQNLYWGALIFSNGGYEADIFRNVAGAWTLLNGTPVSPASATNTLRFDVVGSSLKLFLNGNLVTFASDMAITAPGSVGLRSSNNITFDNFSASAIALNNVTLPFNDDFNRADGPLGPNWLDQLGLNAIQGNQVVTTVIDPTSSDPTKSLSIATVNGVSNADVSVQADVAVGAVGVQYSGPVARYSGPGDQNMYWGGLVGFNGIFQAVIFRNVNGGWTRLNNYSPVSTGTGTVRFDVVGPSLKLYLNNNLVAFASDSVLTAPGTVGMRSTNNLTFDNFASSVITLNNVTLPFSDNFDRTDGQLGPNWLDQLGEHAVQGNQAVASVIDPTSSDPNKSVAIATLAGLNAADVTLQTDIVVGTTGMQFGGLVARYSGSGDKNMYWGGIIGNDGNFKAVIYVNVNGQWHLLVSTAVSSGTGTLKFTVVGTSLTLNYGATTLNATDSQLTTGTVGFRGGAGTIYDNFSAM
jgi:hypothetical protein